MKRVITNQCGTRMELDNVKVSGVYFSGLFNGKVVLGIEINKGEPQTINLGHDGAKEILDNVVKVRMR